LPKKRTSVETPTRFRRDSDAFVAVYDDIG
jgi:hypothetical protein